MSLILHIQDEFGHGDVQSAVSDRLHGVLKRIGQCGLQIQDALLETTKTHFQRRYPGSKHYDPNKVTGSVIQNSNMSPTGGIDIDIPGVRRAYGDITIRPKLRKWLAIPMRREAFGMKPKDFTDAFVVKSKKSGNEFIARNQGGQLVYLFSLVKSVFQRKDSGIMPSDKTFTNNIVKRICRYLDFAK